MRFAGCSLEDLDALAAALLANRVKLPATEMAVSRAGLGCSAAIAADLSSLAALGFNAAQAAAYVGAIAGERRNGDLRGGLTELVVSGPDKTGTMRDTAVVVDQLFAEAKQSVLVVGFALYKGREVFRRLAETMDANPSLEATLCLDISRSTGETTRDADLIDTFARDFVLKEWPGKRLPALYYYPLGLHLDRSQRAVLHAKCIVIDGAKALVTSANPTPAAYGRNIELGVVVSGNALPSQIETHFAALMKQGVLQRVNLPARHLVSAL